MLEESLTSLAILKVNWDQHGKDELFYWRERNCEVDFVVRAERTVTGIEVKSGRRRETPAGMDGFADSFKGVRRLLVGGDGITLEEFLAKPVEHWVRA